MEGNIPVSFSLGQPSSTVAGGVTINFQTNVTERNGHDRTLKEESRQGGSSAPLLATGNIPADGGW
jgi:hypothetical protein